MVWSILEEAKLRRGASISVRRTQSPPSVGLAVWPCGRISLVRTGASVPRVPVSSPRITSCRAIYRVLIAGVGLVGHSSPLQLQLHEIKSRWLDANC
jgi:hypothetical protein